jgi:hypothetical protein
MNLYTLPKEIEEALSAYYSCFDEETGELIVDDATLAEKQAVLDDLQNRSDDLLQWKLKDRANRLARADMLKLEIDRLDEQLKKEARLIDKAEKMIETAFERIYEGKSMNIGTFTLSYRKSEAVIIEDENKISEEFKRYSEESMTLEEFNEKYNKEEYDENDEPVKSEIIRVLIDKGSPEKKTIKEALKNGKVPGAKIETRNNLQIK